KTPATSIGNPLLLVTDYTVLVGGIWAACFAILGIRYLTAFRLTHKLRTTGLSGLPIEWQTRFRSLAKRSGLSNKVCGYISDHVSSPITFGFWKPIVLMPAWFFSGLTPEQCEAVLLHEFAHIRRHDYLANIVQILVKSVLFYHPAVQYISKTIDEDREHACDDFAVLVTNNPESLARALGTIRIKAARDGGVFALSADGPEAPLMHRLKRLMGTPTKKAHGLNGRGYAASLMIAISGAMVLGLGATESQAHPHKQDVEALAGAAPVTSKVWGQFFDETITVNGKAYDAVTFSVNNNGGDNYIINGKKYPSKYSYSVYSRAGKDYVVKQKNGKKYMEINKNWFRVDEAKSNKVIAFPRTPPTPPKYTYTYAVKDGQKYKIKTKNKTGKTYIKIGNKWQKAPTSGGGDHGHKHIKIVDKWVNIVPPKIAPPTFPTPPGRTSTWINEEVRQRVEEAVEREVKAALRVEEALTRADEYRQRNQDRVEAARERAEARTERNLERSEQRREATLERAEQQRERAQDRIEQQRDKVEQYAELAREKNDKLNDRYEIMRDKLTAQLKRDGHLTSTNTQVTMEMTPTDIFINGKQLDDRAEGKYCKILSDAKLRKDGRKRIVIKPGYFHVSNKGDGHNTTYTHND
ncbi:MAG: M48 family metalloprotease, partial [Robiginitomaculum sp.]|nr:M48 family metalloprotease [Robiginitomaculum sp.]